MARHAAASTGHPDHHPSLPSTGCAPSLGASPSTPAVPLFTPSRAAFTPSRAAARDPRNGPSWCPADHGYVELLDTLDRVGREAEGPIFTTDADAVGGGLADLYLRKLPAERRQHYRCNTCADFLRRFGGLCTLDEHGQVVPLLWHPLEAVGVMHDVVAALHRRVRRANVIGIWKAPSLDRPTRKGPGDRDLGRAWTGEWSHLHLRLPRGAHALDVPRTMTPEQRMAELREDRRLLDEGLARYTRQTLDVALELLADEHLPRPEAAQERARWLADLHDQLAGSRDHKRREGLLWAAVARAPAGWCHVSSSVIGTLLDDVAAGTPYQQVRAAWARKVDPTKYRRTQAKPKAGNVTQAEGIMADLRASSSLRRRFAHVSDCELLWSPRTGRHRRPEPTASTGGVFGHVQTQHPSLPGTGQHPSLPAKLPRAGTLTWARFRDEVLPQAERVELLVPTAAPFYALSCPTLGGGFPWQRERTAPQDAPLLQWDSERRRNPVSWYTHKLPTSAHSWGLRTGWTDVVSFTLLPSLWHGREPDQHGQGVVLLLPCRNLGSRASSGRAFFVEQLRSEWHPVRATLEQHLRQSRLEVTHPRTGDGYAVGLGLRRHAQGNTNTSMQVRVHAQGTVRTYTVNGWGS